MRDVFRRLLDAVDPDLVDAAEAALAAEPGVTAVRSVEECVGSATASTPTPNSTSIPRSASPRPTGVAHDAEHTLTHAVPKLSSGPHSRLPRHYRNPLRDSRFAPPLLPTRQILTPQRRWLSRQALTRRASSECSGTNQRP